eukprot:302694-Pleurochrysis_carterae.AAC.1
MAEPYSQRRRRTFSEQATAYVFRISDGDRAVGKAVQPAAKASLCRRQPQRQYASRDGSEAAQAATAAALCSQQPMRRCAG